MSQLVFKGMRVRGRVGCKDVERVYPQMLQVDLRIHYDMTDAIASDDVSKAIDYKAVAVCVRELLAAREWHLIETMAHDIVDALRTMNDRIKRVEIEVTKDILVDVGAISVVLDIGD
jgi:7,8-dihydroneopterin aldolase/epimerase/oxygenase